MLKGQNNSCFDFCYLHFRKDSTVWQAEFPLLLTCECEIKEWIRTRDNQNFEDSRRAYAWFTKETTVTGFQSRMHRMGMYSDLERT